MSFAPAAFIAGVTLFASPSATAYTPAVAQEQSKREPPTPSAEEVLRRMLSTPPKKHSEMVARKAKRPGKRT